MSYVCARCGVPLAEYLAERRFYRMLLRDGESVMVCPACEAVWVRLFDEATAEHRARLSQFWEEADIG